MSDPISDEALEALEWLANMKGKPRIDVPKSAIASLIARLRAAEENEQRALTTAMECREICNAAEAERARGAEQAAALVRAGKELDGLRGQVVMLREALGPIGAEEKNGRNAANYWQGIPTGSPLHLCEMVLAQLERARAALAATEPKT